jgi:UDP-N-acetylglucosamine 2-epimerase (non-hydrolysing)
MKILLAAGARPNFMKIAPLMWEIAKRGSIKSCLVHTGQHYDQRMSQIFFEELGIPQPDVDLGVGSGSHAFQTAEVIRKFEPVVLEHKPDAVVVVGDVNSTLACSITAVKLGVPVAHVEAGLRSFDRTMPEEINRILTDNISRWLFVSERSGIENLRREGVSDERIFFVGNVMIDTLLACRKRAEDSRVLQSLNLEDGNYGVITLHRPSNVDDPAAMAKLLDALEDIQREMVLVFPVHPRSRKSLNGRTGASMPNLRLIEPLGYLDFLKLMSHSRVVFTDSGGIQEETTVMGIPCLTLRPNTERPATVAEGTNLLVGTDRNAIVRAFHETVARPKAGRVPERWDGLAAQRVIDILETTITIPPSTW